MLFIPESSKASFLNKLSLLETAVAQHKLINTRLEVVEKHGFCWILLCLLRPFFSLCCSDAFSHVRVDKVAQSILKYCQANKDYVDESALTQLREKILAPLNQKTQQKYYLENVLEDLAELPPPPPLKWPSDLSTLGLTEAQKEIFDTAFSEMVPYALGHKGGLHSIYELRCTKRKIEGIAHRTLQLQRAGVVQKEQAIPITFSLTNEPRAPRRLTHIILWTKIDIGKGAERKVRRCYDLFTGEFLARKKTISNIEKKILEHFKFYPTPGIEPVISFPTSKKWGVQKDHIIEPSYKGSLQALYDQIATPEESLSIMRQLLTGLTALHAYTPVEVDITSDYNPVTGMTKTTTRTTTYKNAFHLDIKPDNILLRWLPSGEVEAVLIDFGLANTFHPGNGTEGYRPPEDVQFLSELYPEGINGPRSQVISGQQSFERTLSYNYKKDVWGLGLVFTTLLAKSLWTLNFRKHQVITDRVIIPPLVSLEQAFLKGQKRGHFDGHIADLQQMGIDGDIEELKAGTSPIFTPFWDELIKPMLQVDYRQRLSAADALQKFNQLFSQVSL